MCFTFRCDHSCCVAMACLRYTGTTLSTTVKATSCLCLPVTENAASGCLATTASHHLATRYLKPNQKQFRRNICSYSHKQVKFSDLFCRGSRHIRTAQNSVIPSLTFYKGQGSRSLSVLTRQTLSQKDLEEVDVLFQGILQQQRGSLARGITLIESTHPRRLEQAQVLLSRLLKHNKEKGLLSNLDAAAFRIGICFLVFVFYTMSGTLF